MRLIKLFVFFNLLSGILHSKTVAQEALMFKKTEGLNSNVVYCVMQDSKGYIWVGTEAGVSRYDGYKFANYNIEDGLADNDVFQIKEDHKGRLWFLTFSGKPSIYENGHILNGNNTSWLHHIQPKNLAKVFLQDKTNSIWYVTLDTAYHIYNDKVTEKLAPPQIPGNSQKIQSLTTYNDTVFLVSNSGVYNTVTHKIWYFIDSKVITKGNGAVIVNGENLFYVVNNTLNYFSFKKHTNEDIYRIPDQEVFLQFILTGHPDTVYLSTVNHLYKLNTKTKQVIDTRVSDVNSITGIFIDTEGNTWISSLTKGLLMKEDQFNKRIHKIYASGLPDNTACYSFSKIDNGLYIGFDDGYYITEKKGLFFSGRLKYNKYIGKVRQVFRYQKKLYTSFNYGTTTELKRNEIIFEASIKEVAVRDDYMYAATSGGILKIKKSGASERFSLNNLNMQRVSQILLVSKDSLLAGGIGGLHLFVHENLIPHLPWQNSIIKAPVTEILKTSDNHIVFSTENMGLGIIAKDSLFTITKQNGLLSNSVTKICSYQPGLIWVVTTKGINRLTYKIDNNKSVHYKIEDYSFILDKDNQNINDILQSHDTLYLATGRGAYFYLLTQHSSGYIPKVYITNVTINDSSYTLQQLQHLSYKENGLHFNFIGLAFQAKGVIKYRYRLKGADTAWQETYNTFIEYPYLIPGRYEFEVTAALPNGNWNQNTATVAFTIQNPYWKSWWFRLVGGVVFLGLIYVSIMYFINTAKKKHRLINEKLALDKQVIELEQKALHLQMNPHFIFNAINAIKGFYSNNNKSAANEYIDMFAAFMRMLLEKSSSSMILLEEEIIMLKMYLELSALRRDDRFEYEIDIADNIHPETISIPVMIIQPFVENAVIHGIAALASGGKIHITFSMRESFLFCVIEDNGVGRKKSREINKRNEHRSRGISITEQRLKLLSEHCSITITDKTDASFTETGTVVEIKLPV